jgi:hypothetical protein
MSRKLLVKVNGLEILVPINGQEHVVIEGMLRGISIRGVTITSLILNETSINKSSLSIYLSDLDMFQYKRGEKELKKPNTYADSAVITFKLDEERLLTNVLASNDAELKAHYKAGYEAAKLELKTKEKSNVKKR